jgi:hypothetical protein
LGDEVAEELGCNEGAIMAIQSIRFGKSQRVAFVGWFDLVERVPSKGSLPRRMIAALQCKERAFSIPKDVRVHFEVYTKKHFQS